ncbi:hypothetical protein K4H03_30285, partial [Mycobacterium tuberculosis]|nr:hypothetical protein [Mycobacterium tuberculosis]
MMADVGIRRGLARLLANGRNQIGLFAALVLARQQKAPLGALREIWSRHDQARSGLPLLQLGIALKTMGDAPRG